MEVTGKQAARMLGLAFGMSNKEIDEIIGEEKPQKIDDLKINSSETFGHAMNRMRLFIV